MVMVVWVVFGGEWFLVQVVVGVRFGEGDLDGRGVGVGMVEVSKVLFGGFEPAEVLVAFVVAVSALCCELFEDCG